MATVKYVTNHVPGCSAPMWLPKINTLISLYTKISSLGQRSLCTELNVGLNMLEGLLETMRYRKVFPWQSHKCSHKTTKCKSVSWTAKGEETWYHHYEWESKWQSMKWLRANFLWKKKFKRQPSVGKVGCIVCWNWKCIILLISWNGINNQLLHRDADLSCRFEFAELTFYFSYVNARLHTMLRTY